MYDPLIFGDLFEKVCDRHPQESDVKGVAEVDHLAEQVDANIG